MLESIILAMVSSNFKLFVVFDELSVFAVVAFADAVVNIPLKLRQIQLSLELKFFLLVLYSGIENKALFQSNPIRTALLSSISSRSDFCNQTFFFLQGKNWKGERLFFPWKIHFSLDLLIENPKANTRPSVCRICTVEKSLHQSSVSHFYFFFFSPTTNFLEEEMETNKNHNTHEYDV